MSTLSPECRHGNTRHGLFSPGGCRNNAGSYSADFFRFKWNLQSDLGDRNRKAPQVRSESPRQPQDKEAMFINTELPDKKCRKVVDYIEIFSFQHELTSPLETRKPPVAQIYSCNRPCRNIRANDFIHYSNSSPWDYPFFINSLTSVDNSSSICSHSFRLVASYLNP